MKHSFSIQIGQKYRNRKGIYTVLVIEDGRLLVEYENGQQQELDLNTQKRILKTIQQEEKARLKEQKRRQSQAHQEDSIYRNICWRCHKKINSQNNNQCPACGWYICACGACNCNRPSDTSPSIP